MLAAEGPVPHATAAEVRDGYGAALIGTFVRRATASGIRVIGGLPTEYAAPLPDATLAAIHAVYRDNGGEFLELPNRSRYPQADFFDTPSHLSEPFQIAHSRAIATALRALLHPPITSAAR